MRVMGWLIVSLPWLAREVEDARELMGDDHWPYGIEGNRDTLTALLQYSREKGLTERTISPEESFHSSTLELTETP